MITNLVQDLHKRVHMNVSKTITIEYSYLVVTRSRSNYIFDKLQETGAGFVLGVVMEQLTKGEGINSVPLMLIWVIGGGVSCG